MPNGGSDCCGTCWFNARNKGEAGYAHANDPEPNFCQIRKLAIEDPFYTYCGNHPHRRSQRDPIPLGPVFVGEKRKLWRPSPDTPEIRDHLLALAAAIGEVPDTEYPLGVYLDELVVRQLGEFREPRATADLKRIAAFSPGASEPQFARSRATLIAEAKRALARMGALDPTAPVEMKIEYLFHASDAVVVLGGTLSSGRVKRGDRLSVKSPSATRAVRVEHVERDREPLAQASAGETVEIHVRGLDLAKLPGGVGRTEQRTWLVIDLRLVAAPVETRRWWQFWQRG